MVNKFTPDHFKKMPWKNGGGISTELFFLVDKIRISKAEISTNGLFSEFANIERSLILLKGAGFHLKSSEREIVLENAFEPIYFSGEEIFYCTLLNGSCSDFNVMTNKEFAKSEVSIVKILKDKTLSIKANCDLTFIYDIANEILYHLIHGEELVLVAPTESTYILIESTIL